MTVTHAHHAVAIIMIGYAIIVFILFVGVVVLHNYDRWIANSSCSITINHDIMPGCLDSVDWNDGMERWNGMDCTGMVVA